jgi:putative ABC transport system substrate-binding protein
MRRRELITLIGGAAAWPLAVRAQQPAMPVIGFVYPGVPELSAGIVAAFRKGLNETGFVEGRNVTIEFRFGYNDNARLPELAADLVHRRVAVIATPGSTPSALAAKAATATIPIVFSIGGDPVELGLVASLNRPGGHVTGISSLNAELGAKRLGFLHELLPSAVRFAVLLNPNNRNAEPLTRDVQATASASGRQIEIFAASSTRDIDAAFVSLLQKRADALLVGPDPLFDSRRVQLITLATHHRGCPRCIHSARMSKSAA